ncbi:MAG TPA: right-handed parallel beta-helix repeat-containing protein [Armatimonadota bacterium]|jgi:parallel beta-helix repeat protein
MKRRLPRILCLLALPISLFAAPSFEVHAATRYVSQSAPGPVHDGASWSTAFPTVASAASVAQSGDEVWVASGIYVGPVSLASGVSLLGGFGGAESASAQRDPRANRTVLDGNRAGTVVAITAAGSAVTTVDGFVVRNGSGGGIAIGATNAVVISNNIIEGNTADYKGGGISMLGGTTTTVPSLILNNSITGNRAPSGGGGIVATNRTVTIANCTVAANSSLNSSGGGGIEASGGSVTITNDTITGNAPYGVYLRDSNASVTNTIVAFNTVGLTGALTLRNNDVFGNDGGNYGFTTSDSVTGTNGNISIDPKLTNPGRNVRIQPGSPCVDAGNDSDVVGETDIDGQTRIAGSHVDIGADESDGTVWATPRTAWYVAQTGDDTRDGSSWAQAKRTITAALAAALRGDEVWAARGVYPGDPLLNHGVALYGGFAGTETAFGQRDVLANPTILDGAQVNNSLEICSYGSIIDGFTIRNAVRTGIRVTRGTAVISHNTIANNSALNGNGGGVYVDSGARAIITDSYILYNSAASGGGIAVAGTSTIANNTLIGNSATPSGGAICVFSGMGAHADVLNTIVAFNVSGIGCGSMKNITIRNCDVYGNDSLPYAGISDQTGANGNIAIDPRLSSKYRTPHIQPGSPCIDAGDDSGAGSGDTDIDGQARVQGAHLDIGADESDGTTWNVSPRIWRVAVAGDDAADGASWGTARRSIAGALALASGGDEVWVSRGVYATKVTLPPGVALYGGFAGDETAREPRDYRANVTVLDGSRQAAAVITTSRDSIVDGFTVRNATDTGIVVRGSTTIANDVITANGGGTLAGATTNYPTSGGGVAVYSPATIANCTILGNIAGSGAGMYLASGPVRVSGCTISGNTGGGICLSGATAAIVNTLTASNTSYGVSSSVSAVTMRHCDTFGNGSSNFTGMTAPTGTNGNISADPMLSSADREPHLEPGSPCIDAGDDADALGESDVDHEARIQGARVDIGADESNGLPWSPNIQTFHVSPNGDDSRDGQSWANAKQTITAALCLAQAGDQVWVAAGTYTESMVLGRGVGLYGGFAGMESSREPRDPAKNPTVVNGNGNGAVILIPVGGTTIDGLTVQNGANNGIYCVSGPNTITRCIISRNQSRNRYYGGGIYLGGGGIVNSNTFIGNNPDNRMSLYALGGGIYVGDTATISNNTFTQNSAKGFDSRGGSGGGAIYVASGTVAISGNTMAGNSGNAVAVAGGNVDIRGNLIERNRGSGVSAFGGLVTVSNNVIRGNDIDGVAANDGTSGSPGTIALLNNTIAGNAGNGITAGMQATISGDTVCANSGIGISATGTGSRVTNCLVAFNGSGIVVGTNSLPVSNCDAYGNGLGDYLPAPGGLGENGNISADPRLSDWYATPHLQPGSPCIDAGDASGVGSVETDIDGQARSQGLTVDIGSDESDGTAWPLTSRRWCVSTTGSDALDGTSWAGAKATVGAAVSAAAPGDEVWVAKGVYPEHLVLPAVLALYGGFAGTETSRDQRNWRANVTVLGPQETPSAYGLSIVSTMWSYVTVDGFTIQNGGESGIYSTGNHTVIANNIITGSVSAYNGGGITLTRGWNLVTDNQIIANGQFSDGGGISIKGSGLIARNTITGNSASHGGGICASGGPVDIVDNAISGNSSEYYGGGIDVDNGTARIYGNLIWENSAYDGGGGVAVLGSTASVINDTIVGNTLLPNAEVGGGGVLAFQYDPPNAQTFLILANSIVASNATGLAVTGGATVTAVHNAFFSNGAANYKGIADPTGANGNIKANPQFVSASVGDFHLAAGSPAINAGDDTLVPQWEPDLDGHARIAGSHVDLGAYERDAGAPTPFAVAEAIRALRLFSGIETSDAADVARLNVERGGASAGAIDLADAISVFRLAMGMDPVHN